MVMSPSLGNLGHDGAFTGLEIWEGELVWGEEEVFIFELASWCFLLSKSPEDTEVTGEFLEDTF